MSCTIYNNQPYYDNIKAYVGNDTGLANLLTVTVNTKDFKDWLESNFKTTLDEMSIDDIVDKAKIYSNEDGKELLLNLNATTFIGEGKTGLFNNNAAKEREAIDVIANSILEYEHLYYDGKVTDENPLQALRKIVALRLRANIKNGNLTEEQIAYNNEVLNNITSSNPVLFKLAINRPIVRELSRIVSKSNTTTTINDSLDDILQQESELADVEETGFYKSWSETDDSKLTLSGRVKRKLNSLPLLKSPKTTVNTNGKVEYDIDNTSYSGIPRNLSANSVQNTLLYQADYTSREDFLESIKRIALGYEGNLSSLIKLYEDLKQDDVLLNLMYNTFNKVIATRTKQTFSKDADGINANVDQSNIFNDPSRKLYININNAIKQAAYNGTNIDGFKNVLLKELKSYDRNTLRYLGKDNTIAEVDRFSKILSDSLATELMINITPEAIKLYMTDGGTNNTLDNSKLGLINSMINNIKLLVEDRITDYDNFNNEQKQLWRDAEAVNEEYQRPKYIYEPSEYGNRAIAELFNITSELAKYEISNVEANSTNIEGKVVSDIVNPFFISTYYDLFNNPEELLSFLNDKLDKTSYFKHSTGLLEIVDAKGNVVVPGILREVLVDGKVTRELTEYYKDFGYTLLDGVENSSTGDNSKYSKLSKRDWDIQSITAFLNEGNNNSHFNTKNVLRKARYNLITPSDAPKGYYVDGVVIPTNDLFVKGKVNRDSLMFKRIRAIVDQELSEMAKAVSDIFELENGTIKFDNTNKPIVKVDKKDLYKFYHYNGDIYKIEDGNIKLTGNVFKFNRLTLNDKSSDPNDSLNNRNLFPFTGVVLTTTVDNNIVPVLTAEQESSINDYLDNYIIAKASEAYNRFTELDNFIPTKVEFQPYVKSEWKSKKEYKEAKYEYVKAKRAAELKQLAANYVLNYTIQYNEQYNNFTGSPAFYKNNADTIKRNKEAIAGGILNAAFVNKNLNSPDATLGTIKVGGKDVEIKSTFSYITISDPAKSSDNASLIESKLNKVGASDKAKSDILSRFNGNTDIADAQTYITIEELAKRLYLKGELDQYQDLIDRLLDESVELTDNDAHRLNQAIQVQKNFYFDMELSPEYGVMIPNQIKNAELVLIPRFIKNTGLELLYNTMQANSINQANMESTEKATRRRMVKVFDKDGSINDKSISELNANAKAYTKEAKYARLYLQQDTPQHMIADNKAGVQIMKKFIDNIPEQHQDLVTKFFELYTDNIEDSYLELMDRIGYNLESETVEDIDKYFRAVRQELVSRNADDNMLAFATNDEFGNTLMPVSFPSIKKKAEQILNSMFTNSVTRQLIPGFHAAQVSNAGMNRLFPDSNSMSQSEYKAKYGNQMKRLNYMASDKDGYDGYVEVLLPHWAKEFFGTETDVTIEELESAGLTEMIGYRIPTEGKQSIVVMKVVGFLSPAQGSTIVLPDEFVTQTGADFDIDSVYGMYYNTRINRKTGKIEKVPYETDINKLYISYVNRNVDNEINKLVKATYDEINDISYNVVVNSTGFYRLSEGLKYSIKKFHARIKANNITGMDLLNRNSKQYQLILDNDFISDEDKDIIRIMKLDTDNMIDNIIKANRKKELYDRLTDENKLNEAKRVARENDLLSLYWFTKENTISKLNSRKGRTNKLLETMIELMKLPSSFVENKSCSNFDIMSSAKNKIESIISNRGSTKQGNPDIYNPFGQSEYRNRVTSGLELKGISVAWDGVTSILSVSKALAGTNILHKFAKSEYNKEDIIKGYDIVEEDDKYYTVAFRSLGWSRNANLNIDGFLITSYSSQTTANILDNVKDPIIGNLSELFGVFKSIVTVGLNYETASAYIRQPIVDDLATIIRNNNSVFDKSGFDPFVSVELQYLNKVLKVLDSEAEYVYRKADVIDAINKLSPNLLDDYYTINQNGKYIIKQATPYSNSELLNTLANYNETSLRDVLDQFNVLANIKEFNNLSENINQVARLLNTDKVGASKGFVESSRMLDKVENYNGTITSLTKVGEKDIIKAIYPTDEYGDFVDDVMESVYPSLFAQLKYSTKASVDINTGLFDTYSNKFLQLKSMLPTNNVEAISKFEDYVTALNLIDTEFVQSNSYDNLDATSGNELSRIYGLNTPVKEFDITDTSDDNLLKFMKLSPANKVMLLKRYMKDNNQSLLQHLEYNYNAFTGKDQLFMTVDKDGYTKYYELFNNMYDNLNPFVRITALDMIRYAAVREGFSFKQGAITHIIPFDKLYNDVQNNGTGIINQYRFNIKNLSSDSRIIDSFFRQYNDPTITTSFDNVSYYAKDPRAKYQIQFNSDMVAKLTPEQSSKLGLVNNDKPSRTKYIITNKLGSEEKVKFAVHHTINDTDDIANTYLIPINKLEQFEESILSFNPDNNKYKPYDLLVNQYTEQSEFIFNDFNEYLDEAASTPNAKLVYYNSDFISTADMNYLNNRYIIKNIDNTVKPSDLSNWIDLARSQGKKLVINNYALESVINKVLIPKNFNDIIVLVDSTKDNRKYVNLVNKLNKAVDANAKFIALTSEDVNVTDKVSESIKHGLRISLSKLKSNSGNINGEVKTNVLAKLKLEDNEFIELYIDDAKGTSQQFIIKNANASNARFVKSSEGGTNTITVISDTLAPLYRQENNIMYSAIEDKYSKLDEALVTIATSINIEGKTTNPKYDELRLDAKRRLAKLGFNTRVDDLLSLDINNRLAALNAIKDYITAKSKELIRNMDNVVVDPFTGDLDNILSDEVYSNINKGDNQVELGLLRLINEVLKFSDNYTILNDINFNFDTKGLNQDEINTIDNIKKVLVDIRLATDLVNNVRSTALQARNKYMTDVVAALSTNPALMENPDLILEAITDESWATNKLESAYESKVPVFQLMMKKIDTMLNETMFNVEDRQSDYDSKMEEFKSKGATVDDVIKDGRFIMPHTDDFIERVTTLRDEVSEAYKSFGYGSREHDEAKLKLNKFLESNVEQEYTSDYYEAMNNIQDILLSNELARKAIREINSEITSILSNAINNDYTTLTEDQLNALADLRLRKRRLASDYNSDSTMKGNTGIAETDINVANTIKAYNKAVSDFNKFYKDRIVNEEFKELLNENLDKLNKHPEGSKEYDEAERWLLNNTKIEFTANIGDEINRLYDVLTKGKFSLTTQSKLRNELLKHRDLTNTIDGTKYTEDEVDTVRTLQQAEFNKQSTEQLIQAKIKQSPMFTEEFYNRLNSIKGKPNKLKVHTTRKINSILSPYIDTVTGELNTDNITFEDLRNLAYLYNQLNNYNIMYDGEKVIRAKGSGKKLSEEDLTFIKSISPDIDNDKFTADRALAAKRGKSYFDKWIDMATTRSMNEDSKFKLNNMLYDKVLGKKLSPLSKALDTITGVADSHGKLINNDLLNKPLLIKDADALVDKNFKVMYNNTELFTVQDFIANEKVTLVVGSKEFRVTFKSTTPVDKVAEIQEVINNNPELQATNSMLATINKAEELFKVQPNASFTPSMESDYSKLTLDKNGNLVPIGLLTELVTIADMEYNPNPMLYGAFSSSNPEYIDNEATAARDRLNELVETKPTVYYNRTKRDMVNKLRSGEISIDEYNKWFNSNHIYNPYKKQLEPIAIWLQRRATNREFEDFVPNDNWVTLQTKDEFKNDKFVRNQLTINNDSKFRNPEYDTMMKDSNKADLYNYLRETLGEYVTDSRDRFHLNKGYVPTVLNVDQNPLNMVDRVKTLFGVYDIETPTTHINIEDRKVNLPMLYVAGKKPYVKLEPQGDRTDAEYALYKQQVKDANRQIYKDNEKAHVEAISKDYQNSIREFIKVGSEYQNKLQAEAMFKVLLSHLKDSEYVVANSEGKQMINKVASSIVGTKVFATEQKGKSNIYTKAESMYRRYVFNEFEKQAKIGSFNLSKWSRVIRTTTSLKVMTFNFDGGVSNMLFGIGAINAEVMARTYFDKGDMTKATRLYGTPKVMLDIVANSNKDTSDTIEGALFKMFKIVDTHNESAEQRIKGKGGNRYMTTDKLFIAQGAGEHLMQNTTLLAMLLSHRVVNGKVMNEQMYINNALINNARESFKVIDNIKGSNYEKLFNDFVNNNEINNKNITDSSNLVYAFAKGLPNDVKSRFLKLNKDNTKALVKEFESYDDVYSQFELKNGMAHIKDGSSISTKDIAFIRSKTLAVNRKIHGVYDKLGATLAQEYWLGQLAFQFRKHITTAVTKRFKGNYYNELRESFDKGYYRSFGEFISQPFIDEMDRLKHNPAANVLGTVSRLFKSYFEYLAALPTNYKLLPEVDKANIKRMLNDFLMLALGFTMKSVLPYIISDEPKKDKLAAHLIYWGDRLNTEITAYSPVGVTQEAESIWKSPFAGLNIIKSGYELGSILTDELFLIGAEEKDYKKAMYHKRGKYAKQHKLNVWIKKNIPIYNQINKYNNKESNLEYIKMNYDSKK